MITPQLDSYYEKLRAAKRQEYRQLNRQTLPYPQLVFLGDSITEWFPIDRLLSPRQPYANRGIAASNSQHLLDHLPVHLFGGSIMAVVLLIGTNDIGYDLPLETTLANVGEIAEQIAQDYPLATLYLLEILPVNQAPHYHQTVANRTNQAIQTLNRAYADLADHYPHVQLVPTYDQFLDSSGQLADQLTKDGLHLSEPGYEKLAAIVKKIIAS